MAAYQTGDEIKFWDPAAGDVVTLRVDDVEVVVRIREAEDHAYVGVIVGFENLDDLEYRGLVIDGVVAFDYRHIQTCMR